jgi:uncharacterized membrane protein YphA (DoxX/SURF4 family)
MQILAGVLSLIGFLAVVVAIGIVIYVLPYARPHVHRNPDWMTAILRSHKPHIIAYFFLLAVGATALGFALYIVEH